ncbi:MAG: hypothetical protein ACAI25_00135 [Planctomycetota bacterium]
MLFLLLLVPSIALADGVGSELSAKAGTTIDLNTDAALKARLLARGLVTKDATEVKVDAELLKKAFASDRFFNHVNELRYHPGDRILVEDPGSGGTYSNRAEILEVLAGGKYRVKLWDKPEPLENHDVGKTDVFTGGLLDSKAQPTKVRVAENGSIFEKVLREPWLVRSNEREVILGHEQLDALNGQVRPKGVYMVGKRWAVDPANDPVLKAAIERARVIADEVLPAEKLVLPTDPAARKAALEEVARLQERLLTRIYNDNFMSNPIRNDNAKRRLQELPLRRPDLVGKVGGLLESQAGICVEQAGAIQAILEGIGDRGFTSRAMGGYTYLNDFGHGFLIVRLADGKPYMFDPSWHGQGDKHALDNLDFATFDKRMNSNRRINWVSQPTSDKTPFVDRTTDKATDLTRGYDTRAAEAYFAERVRELTRNGGTSADDATRQVLALRELEGTFSARAIAERARAATFNPATPGVLGGLDTMIDRTNARNRARGR